MTPKQYLDKYTCFRVTDPLTRASIAAPITEYGADWTTEHRANGPACQHEYAMLALALKKVCSGGKKHWKPTPRFHLDADIGMIRADTPFFNWSLLRAYVGKGSPDEIFDSLQLAIATGRIGTGKDIAGHTPGAATAADYVKKFITVDCNGYAGNYHGYFCEVKGFANPHLRRKKSEDVRQGDLLVAVDNNVKRRHVAVVERWQPKADGTAIVTLCEWGARGDEPSHYHTLKRNPKITTGEQETYGIGFGSHATFHYVFAPPKGDGHRGWGDKGIDTN